MLFQKKDVEDAHNKIKTLKNEIENLKKENHLPHVMNGFAYVDIILLKLKGNKAVNKLYPLSNEVYIQKIVDDIRTLELLEANDDYAKSLKRRYEALIKII